MQSISVFFDRTEVYDFWWKNTDVSRTGLSRDLYMLWIFFRWGINVLILIILGWLGHTLGRGKFLPPPLCIHEQPPKRSIINRGKKQYLFSSKRILYLLATIFEFYIIQNNVFLEKRLLSMIFIIIFQKFRTFFWIFCEGRWREKVAAGRSIRSF